MVIHKNLVFNICIYSSRNKTNTINIVSDAALETQQLSFIRGV